MWTGSFLPEAKGGEAGAYLAYVTVSADEQKAAKTDLGGFIRKFFGRIIYRRKLWKTNCTTQYKSSFRWRVDERL